MRDAACRRRIRASRSTGAEFSIHPFPRPTWRCGANGGVRRKRPGIRPSSAKQIAMPPTRPTTPSRRATQCRKTRRALRRLWPTVRTNRHAGAVAAGVAGDRAVTARGLPIVFLLRLSPIVPFNFLNYALGLTTIKLRDFLVASAGMIPGAIMYAYAGKVAGVALAVAGEAQVPRETSYYALLIGGLAATMAAVILVARAARRALRDV